LQSNAQEETTRTCCCSCHIPLLNNTHTEHTSFTSNPWTILLHLAHGRASNEEDITVYIDWRNKESTTVSL